MNELLKELLQINDPSDTNKIIPTMGGHYWWNTLDKNNNYKLQKHKIVDLYRVIDSENFLVICGKKNEITFKFYRLISDEFLMPGDVIGVNRGIYEHYGIYLGNDEVIHYAPLNSSELGDSSNNVIHIAPMKDFLNDKTEVFVLDFPDKNGKPVKVGENVFRFDLMDFVKIIKRPKKRFEDFILGSSYNVFSPEETIERAKTRLGEKKYDLITNNCEHFAIWAKTGIKESKQVKDVIEVVGSVSVVIPVYNILKNIKDNRC